ncbi:MAG: hypothetical protein ABI461_14505, partial [Polyangiaceae bacterium]
ATAGFLGDQNATKRERDRAIQMLSAWFGAMMVARAVNDETLALEIIESCKRETLREFDRASAPRRSPKKKATHH